MSDIIDRSTGVILGVLIAVVLICSALIPIVINQINGLKTTFHGGTGGYSDEIVNLVSQYADIIGIVILIVIIGLIIGVVKTYTGGNERD